MSANIWNPGGEQPLYVDALSSNLSQVFTATAGQLVFNITNFSYAVGSSALAVYRNGQRLIVGEDFAETSSTSFTMNSAALVSGDRIEAVAVSALAADTMLQLTTARDAAAASAASALSSKNSAASSESVATIAKNAAVAAADAALVSETNAASSSSNANVKAASAALAESNAATSAATASSQASAATSAASSVALAQANAAAVLGLGIGTSYVDANGHLIMNYVTPVTDLQLNASGHLIITF